MSEPTLNPFPLPSGRRSGDTFPIFRDGVWHLFHMAPPVIAHHVSRDLLHWEARPDVVAPGAPGEPDCNGNATGCVVEHRGTFYLFYTGNQNICLATSPDLDHWTKHPRNPVVAGDNRQYERANFRDAFVFYHEPEDLWWMLFGTRTAAVPGQPGQRAGCVGLAKSEDLLTWRLQAPLWAPQIGPHADCPQLIQMGTQWVLFYLQRNTRYRLAEAATGPFRRPPARNLFTPLAAAGSRPACDGRRWVSFPFVMRLRGEDDWGDWEYGGPLAIPRELELGADGTMRERPAAEVLAAVRALPKPEDPLPGSRVLAGTWEHPAPRQVTSLAPDGGTLVLVDLPADFYLEFSVALETADSDFHLLLRGSADLLHGYQLSLHPRTSQVSLRPLSQWDVDHVLVSRSVRLPVGEPITVRLFLNGSILEVFLADSASLTARLYRHREGLTALEFRDGTGRITDLTWRALPGEA